MIVKRCRHCKRNIPADADFCPECGKRQRYSNTTIAVIVIIGAVVALAILQAPATKDSSQATAGIDSASEASKAAQERAPQEYPIDISPSSLNAQYQANEVRADGLFKNKLIRIYGTVEDISKTFLGTPTIRIATGETFQSLACYFEKEEEHTLINLNKGARVGVIGRCRGMSMRSVSLGDCRLTNSKDEQSTFSRIPQQVPTGKHPSTIFNTSYGPRLRQLVGAEYKLFEDSLTVASSMIDDNQYTFGEGCFPHNCGCKAAAFVIDKGSDSIYAALLKDNKVYTWGAPFEDNLPAPLKRWVLKERQKAQSIPCS